MKITPSTAFAAVLISAAFPCTMRETRIQGQISHDGMSFYSALLRNAGDTSDGWMIVAVLLCAGAGTFLGRAPLSEAGRRYASLTLSMVGGLLMIAASRPLWAGEGLWVTLKPGVGLYLMVLSFVAAGFLSLRGGKSAAGGSRPQ